MKIVVGYLATPGGADALALGVRLARTLDAELHVCVILPHDDPAMAAANPGSYDDLVAQRADTWLAEAVKSLPDDVTVHAHRCFASSFAAGLIEEASRFEADLLVVGGSGGGLAGRRSLGSVVNELLHSAPVPVVVAPRGIRESTVDRVREVTCALGERSGADVLLETAVQISAAAGTPLRLASLVSLDPAFGSLRGDAEAVFKHAVTHATLILDTAKDELPEGFPVTSEIADGDSVEDAVAKLSWHDGDLIMVGSSRLSAPRRLFLGSTAAKMLRVLDIPMMIVPRDQLSEDDLP